MDAEVGFVEDEDAAIGDGVGQCEPCCSGSGLAGIDDFDDEVGAFEFALGALEGQAVICYLSVTGGLSCS